MNKIDLTSYPKDRIKVLFLENISDKAVQYFKQQGYADVKKVAGALSEEELIKVIKDVHILGIRSKTFISKKVLDSAKKLQAIGCFCIGVNQVDLKACKQKGIAVYNAPYSNTRSVAELVIGASILLIRRILDKNKAAHNGIWNKEAKGSFELRGKTMGIIGYGNIGNPTEFTMLELAELVLNLTKSKSRIVNQPLPQDDPKQRKPDIGLAKAALGWEPKVNLEEGLRETISYFKKVI